MLQSPVFFAFPGELDTPSGGYHYDRRLIAALEELGISIGKVSLPHCSLHMDRPTRSKIRRTLADLPNGSIVIFDGLAYGVLDAEAAAEAERLRLVALCHHPLALETGLGAQDRRRLLATERRALSHACATLVTSEHTKRILMDQFAVPSQLITVAYPGTDRSDFAPCAGDPPTLLTLASLIRRKAHDILIDALGRLRDLEWRARFVGTADFDPNWASQLRAQAAALSLSQRIDFIGTVRDTQQEYQHADCFVLPSRFEGYGMVFAEALAAGLPIIAARAGAVPEVVPETAGVLVPPDDRAALAKALRQLLEDSALRRRLQSGARQVAKTLPQWIDSGRRVAHVLQAVEKQGSNAKGANSRGGVD